MHGMERVLVIQYIEWKEALVYNTELFGDKNKIGKKYNRWNGESPWNTIDEMARKKIYVK